MKILFLSDNFPPEVNAPASRTFEHCREWANLGATVTVITSAPNFPQGRIYPGYKNRLYQRESIDGINVIRVWTFIAPNRGFALRVLDYLSFAVMSFIAALFQRTDVIVATSPQFFTACSGYLASKLKRKPWVFEVRDLWPESITAVGAMKDSAVIRMLERLELFLYRAADKIVVVTDSFRRQISDRGICRSKIEVITNGADLTLYSPKRPDPTLRSRLGLDGKFVIGYVGTHGMAHALDFILRTAKKIETIPELSAVHLLLVGDGAEKHNLLKLHRELNIGNVTMLDPVPKEQAAELLNMADAALVNLKRSDAFLSVLPSKIFEAAALGKPILLGVDGEARALIESRGAGVFFVPEDTSSCIAAVKELLSRRPELSKVDHTFSRSSLAQRFYTLLEGVKDGGRQ